MSSTIIEKLYKKEPRFPKQYEYLFTAFSRKGGGSDEERKNKSKVFRNDYEFYMYAFFTGIRHKHRITNRSIVISKRKVWNIQNWQPQKLRDYMMSCVLVEAKIPLREYDFMNEKKLNEKSVELKDIIEEYTHGGLSIIDGRYEEDRHYFNETFAFTNFVFEK